jgi:hypothetical protein
MHCQKPHVYILYSAKRFTIESVFWGFFCPKLKLEQSALQQSHMNSSPCEVHIPYKPRLHDQGRKVNAFGFYRTAEHVPVCLDLYMKNLR